MWLHFNEMEMFSQILRYYKLQATDEICIIASTEIGWKGETKIKANV